MSHLHIKTFPLDSMVRKAIASAVSASITRFRDQLKSDESTVSRIAQAAAEIAIEQFKAWCNNELSLIAADYEQRFERQILNPPAPVVWREGPRDD